MELHVKRIWGKCICKMEKKKIVEYFMLKKLFASS